MSKPKLFISHSHSDWRLAERLQGLIESISGQGIDVSRSSEKGAIKSGENWRDWIDDKVLQCDVAVVVLTPGSFRGRWVLWEAGAVAGVQYERLKGAAVPSGDAQARRVRVIRFTLGANELGPFSNSQVPNGLDAAEMIGFGSELLEDFRDGLDAKARTKGLVNLEKEVNAFVADAAEALRFTPIQRDEGVIQDWLARLDEAKARRDDRWIVAAKRWINTAFLGVGHADAHKAGEAIDFRIHMRLADAHGRLREWEGAIEQLKLAARMSPNDLVIQRELGGAYRSMKRSEDLKDTLARMEELDPAIFKVDREGIALRCGFLTMIPDWPAAERALEQADAGIVSADLYLANWRAIASMKAKGAPASRPHFEQLRQLLQGRQDLSFWDRATLVNALLALSGAAAQGEVVELGLPARTKDEIESATRFFDDVLAAFGHTFDWRAAAGLVPPGKP
jgi:tetratricopeptide (TPR) repeat protein